MNTNETVEPPMTAEQERAAVVAWLRANSRDCWGEYTLAIDAADAIERGEHLRGGGE